MKTTEGYPMSTSQVPRRLIIAGHWGHTTRQLPSNAPEGKETPPQGDSGEVPVLITPPIQNDRERGEGDSTNSRLHRLTRGDK
jgi:hypothetical protein